MIEKREPSTDYAGIRPELLRDIIVYFGQKTILNGTRVQKLMYLVEVEYAKRHGSRLMDYDFYHDQFGMNSLMLERRVLDLRVSCGGPLEITTYDTERGTGYRANVRKGIPEPHLPSEVKEACDLVLKEYASLNITRLMVRAKRTLPFYGTKRGARVDWSLLGDKYPLPLEAGWNGPGSVPVTREAWAGVRATISTILSKLPEQKSGMLPAIRTVPLNGGGLHIIWTDGSWELTIEVPSDGSDDREFLGEDGTNSVHGNLKDKHQLANAVSFLATRLA